MSIPVNCDPEWLKVYEIVVATEQAAAQCLVVHDSLKAAAGGLRARLEDLGVEFVTHTTSNVVKATTKGETAPLPGSKSLSPNMRSKLKLIAWLWAERDRLLAGGPPVDRYPRTLRQAVGLAYASDKAFLSRLKKAVDRMGELELATSYNNRVVKLYIKPKL